MKISLAEDKSTLSILDLIQNAVRVLPQLLGVSGPGKFKITNPRWDPIYGMKMVQSSAKVADDKGQYNAQIHYYDVPDADSRITNENPVRVSCTCPEYRTLFAIPNKENDVHAGAAMSPEIPSQYRKRNPKGAIGLCRHLLAVNRLQRKAGWIQ